MPSKSKSHETELPLACQTRLLIEMFVIEEAVARQLAVHAQLMLQCRRSSARFKANLFPSKHQQMELTNDVRDEELSGSPCSTTL